MTADEKRARRRARTERKYRNTLPDLDRAHAITPEPGVFVVVEKSLEGKAYKPADPAATFWAGLDGAKLYRSRQEAQEEAARERDRMRSNGRHYPVIVSLQTDERLELIREVEAELSSLSAKYKEDGGDPRNLH